jgi:phenylalanyl-tRNA synthetase alpha chain
MENYIKLIEGIKLDISNSNITSKEEYYKQYLGSNGVVKQVYNKLKEIPSEKRKEAGELLRGLKEYVENYYEKI